MKKFSLIIAIYFAFILIWSIFLEDSQRGSFLSIETSIWNIRIIYGVLSAVFILVYFIQINRSTKSY